MGNAESNVTSGVKKQADTSSILMYKLVDLKGGGLLVELMKRAARTKQFAELDHAIKTKVEPFLYNKGEGRLIPISHLVLIRNKERPRHKWLPYLKHMDMDTELDIEKMPIDNDPEKIDPKKCREVCWDLMERGAVGETILHLCLLNATSIHADLAKRLLRFYPKLINDIYMCDEYYGESVLHIAIVNEDPAMVKFLLDSGADYHERCTGNFMCPEDQKATRQDTVEHEWVNLSPLTNYEGYVYWGEYPLSFAACLGQEECFRLMLARGANPDNQDTNGNTVLHMLVIYEKLETFDMAYEVGANISVRNVQNLTPLTLAAKLARIEMFFHILNIEREIYWQIGSIACAAYPLGQIDTIDIETGHISKNSALNLVVFGDKDEHLELMDGVLVDLLNAKWNAFVKLRFYRQFFQFLIYFLVSLVCFTLRPGPLPNGDPPASPPTGAPTNTSMFPKENTTDYVPQVVAAFRAVIGDPHAYKRRKRQALNGDSRVTSVEPEAPEMTANNGKVASDNNTNESLANSSTGDRVSRRYLMIDEQNNSNLDGLSSVKFLSELSRNDEHISISGLRYPAWPTSEKPSDESRPAVFPESSKVGFTSSLKPENGKLQEISVNTMTLPSFGKRNSYSNKSSIARALNISMEANKSLGKSATSRTSTEAPFKSNVQIFKKIDAPSMNVMLSYKSARKNDSRIVDDPNFQHVNTSQVASVSPVSVERTMHSVSRTLLTAEMRNPEMRLRTPETVLIARFRGGGRKRYRNQTRQTAEAGSATEEPGSEDEAGNERRYFRPGEADGSGNRSEAEDAASFVNCTEAEKCLERSINDNEISNGNGNGNAVDNQVEKDGSGEEEDEEEEEWWEDTGECRLWRVNTYEDVIRLTAEVALEFGALLYLLAALREASFLGLHMFIENLMTVPSRVMFLFSCLMMMGAPILRFSCEDEAEDILAVMIMLLTSPYFLFFCRGFKTVGPFVVMIYRMVMGDLLRFVSIYMVFVMGFSQAYYIIFLSFDNPSTPDGVDDTVSNPMPNPVEAGMAMFLMSLNTFGDYFSAFEKTEHELEAKVCFVIFMGIVAILLVNMLIAMMGNTYQKIAETRNEWQRQWARIVLVVERGVPPKERLTKLMWYSQPMSDGRRALVLRLNQTEQDKEEMKEILEMKRVHNRIVEKRQKRLAKLSNNASPSNKPLVDLPNLSNHDSPTKPLLDLASNLSKF
nr:PREDICTED: uncharacterized protein LOC109032930 [Bemisia tabaci]